MNDPVLVDGGGGAVVPPTTSTGLLAPSLLVIFAADIDFVGAGIDQTIIKNHSDAAADTEPFNFSGTARVKIRNMTVSAERRARPATPWIPTRATTRWSRT